MKTSLEKILVLGIQHIEHSYKINIDNIILVCLGTFQSKAVFMKNT